MLLRTSRIGFADDIEVHYYLYDWRIDRFYQHSYLLKSFFIRSDVISHIFVLSHIRMGSFSNSITKIYYPLKESFCDTDNPI